MKDVIDDLEKVFILHNKKDYVLPYKVSLRWGDKHTEETRGRINAMPGYVGGDTNIAGIKWIGSGPQNPMKYDLPRASALIILNDAEKMLPLAIMDGTIISAMRTGGVTGTATKYLARPDSKIAGIIGAGTQNRTQIMAIKTVMPKLSKVKVYDLYLERSKRFAVEVSEELGIEVVPVLSAEEAIRDTDIIVTATTAKEPIVKAEWIGEGCFYSHVGGHEAEFDVISKANKIVVDDWEQIKHRGTQTLAIMHEKNEMKDENIYAEIGDIITQKKKGRENETEFIYFNGVGMALEDIIVANRIYSKALENGVGTVLELWDKPIWI
ncbi:ornithine cyclodeaminase [Anaeromicrobium sediminis]|uniref:Ornithine cyclodeaminase n=2 Tax=Anaeromicrobium sediminis TaxID=1478221 RepID=A0A267MLL5_9FIRM|nr:ornithine cyclodeaminase [Anaeromicrobium sediminis]